MRNNNWIVWIVVLFFGWSIVAMIAGTFAAIFGFPYIWVMPITLLMLGGVIFLVSRGYPIQAWLLVGCAGFIVLSALTLVRAVTVAEPDIPDVYRQEFDNEDGYSFMGIDLPFYGGYGSDYLIEFDSDRENYLVPAGYEMRTPVTVIFAPVQTAGGQWAFESGSLRVQGEVNGTFAADPAQNWVSADEVLFDSDQPLRSIRPQITILIPLPYYSSSAPLDARAEVTISYPMPDGAVQSQTLSRSFQLSVIGEDYYRYYNQYSNWKRSRSVIDSPLWIALVAGCGVAGVVGVYLLRQGDLQPRMAGGLMLVIRRLSGAQKLGVELHTLAKVRGVTDATEGVYIGRVIAQSPAGRAGFRTGDVLITLGGKTISGPGAVNRIARGYKKGDLVEAVVQRSGESVRLLVRF
ncbi:MAG: PDZ domain-containing protein [Chloroflexi bacterium]|nr:PDZ domain-containing protein [Chloroflexota bacterium]